MFSFLCAVAFASPEPLLLFSARIYFPPGDKRMSHYQLYVSDLHGKHRRQLTHGNGEMQGMAWISRDAMAWMDENGKLWASKLSPFQPQSSPTRTTRSSKTAELRSVCRAGCCFSKTRPR